MSNVGLSMQQSPSGGQQPKRGGRKTRKKHSRLAVLFAVVLVAGLVAVVGYGGYLAYGKFQAAQPAEDYPDPGRARSSSRWPRARP